MVSAAHVHGSPLPSLDHVLAAQQRLQGITHRTPVIRSTLLSEIVGGPFLLKAENLQRGGAFKLRGAYNKLASLSPEQRQAGVIAFSSGNHAQGVALAAREFRCSVTVVMPEDVSPVKKAAVEGYGARVVLAGTTGAEREQEARRLAAERGLAVIPAFEDPHIIAGQGTVALEVLADVSHVDTLVVPIGGGGLAAGCALAVKASRPETRVIGVEPEGAADAFQSFKTGVLQRVERPATLADGLRAQQLGGINWELIRRHVDDIVLVSEEEIRQGMILLLTRTKLLAEASGAVAAAAVLFGKVPVSPDKTTVAIVSGGNVDPRVLADLLAGA